MNNRGLSLEERAHEMHLMLWKDLMNKTSVTTQAQYFTFIGQIPRNSHEYHLYNTSRSMGRRGRSRRPWWISSTVRLEAKVGRKGTRVAFCPPKDASVRWRGGQAGSAMAREHPCCLPIEQGTRRPGSQGSNPCLHKSAQFQPNINHTRKIDEEFFFNNQACLGKWPPDLCLISSPNADRDPYCQLSLAQLGLAAP